MEIRPGADAPSVDESADRARGSAEDALGAIKEAAGDAVSSVKAAVKEKTRETISGAQADAAAKTRTAASALRDTSQNVDEDLPWLGNALRKAADGLDHLTDNLRTGDINQTLHRVSDFGRRQPAIFLGLSVAVGFALARVGKTAIEGVQEAADTTPKTDGADAVYAPDMGA